MGLRPISVLLGAASLLAGCGDDMGRVADGGAACATENCSDPDPDEYACQDVVDGSGRPMTGDILEGLSDPIATSILRRPGACPSTYAELVQKLELEDRSRCAGGPRASMLGRVISERGQLLGRADASRVVVSRTCARREAFELMFAFPTIDAQQPELPTDVEVIAFDHARDTFNFYSLRGSTWTFHGDSFDLSGVGEGAVGECGECHTDGGLVMRELAEPWTHWEAGGLRTAGAAEILDRYDELGGRGNGPELEQVVRAGNRRWNESRIGSLLDETRVELHGGSLRELLRPLFCATAINTGSHAATDADGRPQPVSELPWEFFVDPLLGPQRSVPVTSQNYLANLDAVASTIETVLGARDTVRGFTFVQRAGADVAYVERLISARIIDEEFALDVLSIDITRPVFSSQRCALLEFAPDFVSLDGAPPVPADDNPPLPETGCCEAHLSPGCDDATVQECVCALDASCCATVWDQICVNRLLEAPECGTCGAPSDVDAQSLAGGPAQVANTNSSTVRRAFYAALDAANPEPGSPAAQLRNNLRREGQASEHRAAAERFVGACNDRSVIRDQLAFLRDVSDVMAAKRLAAEEFTGVLDTPGAVAIDTLMPPIGTGFDPGTCELQPD